MTKIITRICILLYTTRLMPILDIHTPTYSFETLDTRFVEECKAAYNTKRAEYSVEGQASHMDERYLLKKTEQRKTTKIRKNEKEGTKTIYLQGGKSGLFWI